MQEDLRLLILIIGFVGVVFLMADGVRKRFKKNRTQKFAQRVFENTTHQSSLYINDDPLFDDGALVEPSGPAHTRLHADHPEHLASSSQNKVKEDVILFAIKPIIQDGFSGRALEPVLKAHDYHYGENNIFHRHVDDDPDKAILFSLAQSIEPGSFDLDTIKQQRIQGLVIFMLWSVDEQENNPMNVFDRMLRSARQLAAALNGELCDNRHGQLNAKAIEQVKGKIQNAQQAILSTQAD